MKVLLVTSIFPPDIGGPARQVWDLAKRLKKLSGLEPIVLTFGNSNRLEEKKSISIYRSKAYSSFPSVLGTLIRQLNFLWRLVKVVRREKVEIIHCHEIAVLGLLSGIVSYFYRIPSVVKYPGDLVYETINKNSLRVGSVEEIFNYNLESRLIKGFEKCILLLYSRIWAASKYQKQLLTSYLKIPEKRIIVMPNYIDISKFVRRKKTIKEKTIKILVVGRPVPWKQTDKLGLVIDQLKNVVSAEFMVVGNDRAIERKIRNSLNRKNSKIGLRFFGQISPGKMWQYFNRADILLSLACYEPFGIVFVEAGAAGLPVVAPKTGGIPEVVKDNKTGLLYKINDWQSAVNKLKRLIKERELYGKMSQEAYQAAKKYDINQQGKEIINFYEIVNSLS